VTYALLALSYLVGAIPTSYWVGRAFHGIDLRAHGSGNLGATNAFRVLGWKWAVPVLAVDIAKGFVPVHFFGSLAGGSLPWALAFGAAAIVGHMFSAFVGFRGGKGVATGAGVMLGLAPWAALAAFAVWASLLKLSGYVSVASIAAAGLLPLLVTLLPPPAPPGLTAFCAAMGLFVIWAHRGNIGRLRKGEEKRIGRRTGDATVPPSRNA